MIHEVKAREFTWELHKETILRYIPGVLNYPRRRSRRHFAISGRVTIDIDRILTENTIVGRGVVRSRQYIYCLKDLMDNIEKADRDSPVVQNQNPLFKALGTVWRSHGGDPSSMLLDFVCFAELVRDQQLGGSAELQMALSAFFVQNSPRISGRLPLSKSLQYVDMCSSSDFAESMEALLAHLPPRLHRELEDRGGRVKLYITRSPSDSIQRYMLHMAPRGNPRHPRSFREVGPRGHHRLSGYSSSSTGPVTRSISAERLLERNIDMYDIAERGGRVIIPGRGRRSPSQGPSRRNRH